MIRAGPARRGAGLPNTGRLLAFLTVALALPAVLFPIYWMVTVSLKTPRDILRAPSLWPSTFTLDNYRKLLWDRDFIVPVMNSLVVAATVTVIALVFGALAAYALTRFRTRFRGLVGRIILLAYLTPTSVLFIPLAIIMSRLGLGDSLAALVIVYLGFALPLSTWMLMSYFRSVPRELEEQAMIDGMSRVGALLRVVLPLSAPGLAAVAIFVFTGAWNEMLLALVLITSTTKHTAPVTLSALITSDVLPWGPLMAGAVLSSVPLIAVYLAAERFIVLGLSDGAVKG